VKVFISGKMTGEPDYNRPLFNLVAEQITRNGDVALNPAIFPDGLTYQEYMTLSTSMLKIADEMIQLPKWQHSRGAVYEHAFAIASGIKIREYGTNIQSDILCKQEMEADKGICIKERLIHLL
jgi:hypothetical protein